MEKRKMISLFVFGLFLWLLPQTADAQVSVNCATESLQTAISNNPAGTTFSVTGICNENITIGAGRQNVTINGGGTATINGTDTANATVYVYGQGVTITGFTITGGIDGINVLRGGTATIQNNVIQNTGGNGILVIMNSYATIINNTISNNPTSGIYIAESASARVGILSGYATVASPNTIASNGYGILVYRNSFGRIVGNTISNNTGDGVVVTRESQADISNNVINGNGGSGIWVALNSGVNLGNATGSTIFDLPNSTTVNNGAWGVRSSGLSYVEGRLGTLNGGSGVEKWDYAGIATMDPLYQLDMSGGNAARSQMHFSKDGSDTGGWFTSVLENNFFVSSGAVYDQGAGGWIQKSSDGKSVYAGSGGSGYSVYLQSGGTVGSPVTAVLRFRIDYSGNVGLGVTTPSYPLHMASGAYCTAGGVWTNASSIEYKENIEGLSKQEALVALNNLTPVKFNYKADAKEKHVGFIAEEVPDLLATQDRKGVSSLDIVAVLTRVIQEQQKTIQEQEKIVLDQRKTVEEHRKIISTLSERMAELERVLKLRGAMAAVTE